ncbi:alpha/beta hydrolase [Pontibacter sp. H259]|uniref:alpha/beta fold hydrolase n=1 Tax=Pontibacter sp. H259 TaxID=3133421 RepID=UPI0030BB39C7
MKLKTTHVVVAAITMLIVATTLLIRADIPAEELKAKYSSPASRFISIDGANLHYLDEGQGTPVVLLHGTAASLNTWDGWATELSKNYRVLRLDLPGFGLTGPNKTHTYTIEYYAELLLHFLDEQGIDRVHLAGSSLGGQIAYEFAANHPERVEKLILISPTGVTKANNKSTSLPFLLAQLPLVKETLKYITPRFIVQKSLKEVYGNDALLTENAITLSHEMLLREGNREAFIARINTQDADNLHKLSKIQAPTFILWGEADAWIPVTDAAQFKQRIKGAQLKLYPGAGHIPMEELPQQTVQDALLFLNNNLALNN